MLIVDCNLMPYWERGQIRSQMPYRFGRNLKIDATIGLNIGLSGINITLIGNPINQHNDTIDFNEYFDWTWSQGKPGFGYDGLFVCLLDVDLSFNSIKKNVFLFFFL